MTSYEITGAARLDGFFFFFLFCFSVDGSFAFVIVVVVVEVGICGDAVPLCSTTCIIIMSVFVVYERNNAEVLDVAVLRATGRAADINNKRLKGPRGRLRGEKKRRRGSQQPRKNANAVRL